jgi:hypothetical protein
LIVRAQFIIGAELICVAVFNHSHELVDRTRFIDGDD